MTAGQSIAPEQALATHGPAMRKRQWTRGRKVMFGTIGFGSIVIAGVGFTGSYTAVRLLAVEKGFGWFADVYPLGIDVGIAVLLALDLALTWIDLRYPLLRYIAWLLTGATVAFNAAASWPDVLASAMHAVIPLLFISVTEAVRHAIEKATSAATNQRMDSIRLARWLLSPVSTWNIWRDMKLWEIRSYSAALERYQQKMLYRQDLKSLHGRGWRRKATGAQLRPLRQARLGLSVTDQPAPTLLSDLADVLKTLTQAELQVPEASNSVQPAELAATESAVPLPLPAQRGVAPLASATQPPAPTTAAQPGTVVPVAAQPAPEAPAPAGVTPAPAQPAVPQPAPGSLAASQPVPAVPAVPAPMITTQPVAAQPAPVLLTPVLPAPAEVTPTPAQPAVPQPVPAPAANTQPVPAVPAPTIAAQPQTVVPVAAQTAPVRPAPAQPAAPQPTAATGVLPAQVAPAHGGPLPSTTSAGQDPQDLTSEANPASGTAPAPGAVEELQAREKHEAEAEETAAESGIDHEDLEDEEDGAATGEEMPRLDLGVAPPNETKSQKAARIYLAHQRAGVELTKPNLAKWAGYQNDGSGRTQYNRLEQQYGPILVNEGADQLDLDWQQNPGGREAQPAAAA
ncbi:DUF2637 domain-containing protein [Kitasatospora sp. NBC_00240]|uniref:DUF2637 domain-containing protein n=1 Tax=Kitasatospora sp. NBC_00240 TaxID=2903567 RepID=UPI00224CBDA0|nr:DUF2637 domain-containing protein [Kitasatospora sp. NBC_00240]MCX5215704.1 DUF2637 domain-containing protein [Kitasatospora sp. NBC_00240]